jgi:hypothetical protein
MNKFFIAVISFSVLSCSKSKTNIDTDKVQVRIENVTGFTLENAKVADINYGDVINHQLTGYKILNEPVYAGYCMFNINGIQSAAGVGVCGSPLPPPFDAGYYTFKIMPAVNGYNPIDIIKQ